MNINTRDRVKVYNLKGVFAGEGTVVNVNPFREPSQEYAVDLDVYTEDVIFVGKEQLEKIE